MKQEIIKSLIYEIINKITTIFTFEKLGLSINIISEHYYH